MTAKAYTFYKINGKKKTSIAIIIKYKGKLIAFSDSQDNIIELLKALDGLISAHPKRKHCNNVIVSSESHLVAKADLIKLISETQDNSKYKLEDNSQFNFKNHLFMYGMQISSLTSKYDEDVTAKQKKKASAEIQFTPPLTTPDFIPQEMIIENLPKIVVTSTKVKIEDNIDSFAELTVLNKYMQDINKLRLGNEISQEKYDQSRKVIQYFMFIKLNLGFLLFAYINADNESYKNIIYFNESDADNKLIRDQNNINICRLSPAHKPKEEFISHLYDYVKRFEDAYQVAKDNYQLTKFTLQIQYSSLSLTVDVKPALDFAESLKKSPIVNLETIFAKIHEQLIHAKENIYLLAYDLLKDEFRTIVRYKNKELPLNIETINQYILDVYKPNVLPRNEKTADEILDLIKQGRALVKTKSSSEMDFLINQLLDPIANRPIKRRHPNERGSDKFNLKNWCWEIGKETKSILSKDTIYTPKTSASLLPKNGLMSFYSANGINRSDQIQVIFIFNELQCYLSDIIAKENVYTYTRFWKRNNSQIFPNRITITTSSGLFEIPKTKFCSSIAELQQHMSNYHVLNPQTFMPHNEVMARLSKNALIGLSCVEQTVSARLKLLGISENLSSNFNKNLPIILFEKPNFIAVNSNDNFSILAYDEEYQVRDCVAAINDVYAYRDLINLGWFSELHGNIISVNDLLDCFIKRNKLTHALYIALNHPNLNSNKIIPLFQQCQEYLSANPDKTNIVAKFIQKYQQTIFSEQPSFKNIAWLIDYPSLLSTLANPISIINNDTEFTTVLYSLTSTQKIKWNLFIADTLRTTDKSLSLKCFNLNKELLITELKITIEDLKILSLSCLKMVSYKDSLGLNLEEIFLILNLLKETIIKRVDINNTDIDKNILYLYLYNDIKIVEYTIKNNKLSAKFNEIQQNLDEVSKYVNVINNFLNPDQYPTGNLLLEYHIMNAFVKIYNNATHSQCHWKIDSFKEFIKEYEYTLDLTRINHKEFYFKLAELIGQHLAISEWVQECYSFYIKKTEESNHFADFEQVSHVFGLKIKHYVERQEEDTNQLVELLEHYCDYLERSKGGMGSSNESWIKQVYYKSDNNFKQLYLSARARLANYHYEMNRLPEAESESFLIIMMIDRFADIHYLGKCLSILQAGFDTIVNEEITKILSAECLSFLQRLNFDELEAAHIEMIHSLFQFLSESMLRDSMAYQFFQVAARCLAVNNKTSYPTIKEYNQLMNTMMIEDESLKNYSEILANIIYKLKNISPEYNKFIISYHPVTNKMFERSDRRLTNSAPTLFAHTKSNLAHCVNQISSVTAQLQTQKEILTKHLPLITQPINSSLSVRSQSMESSSAINPQQLQQLQQTQQLQLMHQQQFLFTPTQPAPLVHQQSRYSLRSSGANALFGTHKRSNPDSNQNNNQSNKLQRKK